MYLLPFFTLFATVALSAWLPMASMKAVDPRPPVNQADGSKEAAPPDSGAARSRQEGLAAALNPDGSLRVGTDGRTAIVLTPASGLASGGFLTLRSEAK